MRSDILQQAQAIRASMDAAAIVLTDEQAAKSPRLYPTWAAGLTVKAGDRLYYPGTDRLYKVVSDHTTQADWTHGRCTGFVYRHRRGVHRDAG